jgi:ABC-type multidrug transport system fused ATPase/permease subunit
VLVAASAARTTPWAPTEGHVKFQNVFMRYTRYVANWSTTGTASSATGSGLGGGSAGAGASASASGGGSGAGAGAGATTVEKPPLVLQDVSFEARPREKLAIVGRTGAGKSSLAVALFRLVEIESGSVSIDGTDTAQLGLTELRRNIAIIPQDPVVFSTSVRDNCDPFHERTDAEIKDALRLVGLPDALVHNLEMHVAEEGSNLSVGQRQLLCLARAILRRPKVLVMDEATASVDQATDNLIQRMVHEHFRDCTVLTIAHRLQTVMDADRVLVMDDGRVSAIDTPEQLICNESAYPTSILREMVHQHKPEEAQRLIQAAKKARRS